MVRHTNTWIFNITDNNWDQCVRGPTDASIHGEENIGRPVQATRVGAPAPTNDLNDGDLVLARNKEHGIAGIWEVREISDIDESQDRSLWDDADYDTIIYCGPIQRELDSPYDEDWSEFSSHFGESVQTVTANIQGAIHNLKPKYKGKYLSELLDHEGVNQDARTRLQNELGDDSTIQESDGKKIAPYWQTIEKKRRLAQEFLDDPSQTNFEALLDPNHFWSQLDRMYDYDMEQIFIAHSADELADLIEQAKETDSPELLNDIHRFGWAKTTELLRCLEPNEYAILNLRAVKGMQDLGYDTPDRGEASPEEYKQFIDDVRDAADRYDLRDVGEGLTEGDIPDWITDLEVADYVFSRNYDGDIDLTELNGGDSEPTDPLSKLESLLEAEGSQAHLYRQAAAHLVAGKNVVFYGPPGTGKTRAAVLLSDALCASKELVTANAEWSNYQVVGGYRPAGESWEPDTGFLTAAAKQCGESLRREPPRPSWLIIDELNRANLDEAFGDVFTLLDLDYRTAEPLSYADKDVYVPLSFRILATMNTYDQAQLFSLGYAFRRRFAFVSVPSLLTPQETPTNASTTTASLTSPSLDGAGEELVDLVEAAAIDAMMTGAEPGGVTPQDVATIFSDFASEEDLRDALESVRTAASVQTDGLNGIETLAYFCLEITDRDVIDVGQALLIDATKYLIAYQLLFEETTRATLDDAIVAYIVPQFEHFMSDLRRAETIDQDSDARGRFEEIIDLARDLDLPKTASVLKDAKETKRILS